MIESDRGVSPPSHQRDGGALARRRSRECLARALTLNDGVEPEALVANTLDEEAVDGELSGGRSAHYAWRERLHRVDKLTDREVAALERDVPSSHAS